MLGTFTNRLLSASLSLLLAISVLPLEAAGQQSTSGYTEQGAPLSSSQLQQLVAPVALYPDALVAQVLGAAAFPDQVEAAAGWLKQNQNLSGSTLMTAVNSQPWEPSVKALTQFPSVLENLANNLGWTSALGEAYSNQSADVMAAVQALRAQAYSAGNLRSGSQIIVTQQSPQVITIEPANPEVVYVPEYNPAVVYGTPYVTPGYSAAAIAATSALAFGTGVAVGAALSGGCCGWGYSAWNCNWHGGTVVYGNSGYYGNGAWHGGYYGSSATAYGPNGAARVGNAYNPSTGTYARGASAVTPYGTQKAGQAYNPRTGAYGATHQASNAYGSYGSSVVSKNGETAYTQHQTTTRGSVGSVQTSDGGRAVASSGGNGNYSAGKTANGNKYATANGNVYKNTGNGWQQTRGDSSDARGWSSTGTSHGVSAFGGEDGWQAREESARGRESRAGGGGWGGRGGGVGRRR
ncbi:MAG TPA: DUF3300 domain-containing protein [Candidatus Cybelea sp.]|nr:DUF3300 domain-containing protein [Candidatus Cybelea sp.]